jgi:hypothetical protein
MAYYTKADLKFRYNWNARSENDNPKFTGFPDNVLLDRNEGYEVLYLINQIAEENNWKPDNGVAGHKIERMLQQLPGNIRSRANVKEWIANNWTRF